MGKDVIAKRPLDHDDTMVTFRLIRLHCGDLISLATSRR
jgi:hypothetical protein